VHCNAETETDFVHFMYGVKLKSELNHLPVVIVIEKVNGFGGNFSMPSSSAFNFASVLGTYLCSIMFRLRVEQVAPQTWQKALSLGNSRG
jgi:hypothetical protein